MSTRDTLATLLDSVGNRVAFAAQGLSHTIVSLVDVLAGHDDRITDLERRLAEYDDRCDPLQERTGPPATPPEPAPAAPTPDSSSVPAPLPGQITIDDIPAPRTLAGQGNRARLLACLREHGGRASRKTITNMSGIKVGSVADAIQNAIRDGAIVDTDDREKTRGPSSPIYALAAAAAGSRADSDDRTDQALGQLERDLLLGPEQAAAMVREQDAPALPRDGDTVTVQRRDGGPTTTTRRTSGAKPAVSTRVRREMERAARQAAGEDLPVPRTQAESDMHNLRVALTNGPRDHAQLARILGVSPRRAAELMVEGHQAGKIVVEQGVARLL